MQKVVLSLLASLTLLQACSNAQTVNHEQKKEMTEETNHNMEQLVITTPNPNTESDTITLGAGCFWCVEAVFQRIEGVTSVESGFANGKFKNPSYREVCTGRTGHAEVAQIVYDPKVVSLAELLEIFWLSHDPTQLNKQGNDVGTQYRSGIYYRNDYQKEVAEKSRKIADESGLWKAPIVTEVAALENYSKAEDYHQNYYNDNGNQPYCSYVIRPKVEKVHKLFKEKLKDAYQNE
ncbi:peptide-methionine (S)-S-oxide reductase MsrA [bacterium]|nr:peptide-methionine (S)-S-oxide reductase MsrA [bacterium]